MDRKLVARGKQLCDGDLLWRVHLRHEIDVSLKLGPLGRAMGAHRYEVRMWTFARVCSQGLFIGAPRYTPVVGHDFATRLLTARTGAQLLYRNRLVLFAIGRSILGTRNIT